MQELKIVFTNELDMKILDKDFYILLLQQIKELCGKKWIWDRGVCLSWNKWTQKSTCLSPAKGKRKLFLVKGKMYCFATLD